MKKLNEIEKLKLIRNVGWCIVGLLVITIAFAIIAIIL